MFRWEFRMSLSLLVAIVLCGAARGSEQGQALLSKATDVKLAAESLADLNQVVTLCQDAIKAGLDETDKGFANGLLASTLTQRAELVCRELFERPMTPGRGRRLVEMAIADLEQTLTLDAEQAEAQYLIGRLYAHLGQTEKATKALDEAVRLSQDEPQTKSRALIIRANLRQDATQRQADYDEAVKLTPHDPNVLRFRGMHYVSQGDFAAAIADLNAAIALEPRDADTHEALGVALSLAQKYDEAMDSFNKAIELEPEAPAAYIHRARVRAIKGDLPAALADVDTALKLQPGSVAALQLRASLFGSAGKFEQALADLNLLRRAMPDNPELLLQIAGVYQAAKEPQKAVATYDHAIEVAPKLVAAFRGRADSYLSLGEQAQAVSDYEAALRLEPKNSGVLNNLAWVLATSPEDKLRDGKRSIELAKEACEATEYKQAHILSTLAAGYAETGEFETAVTWSKKAVEQGGDELKPQLSKELESYEARKPWREALPSMPDDESLPAKSERSPGPPAIETARNKSGG
jgi:tetratricopeptide (TPR) repeat protein